MTGLTVVIPAYNEETGISDIARRVLATREELASVGIDQLELIVVDDGSHDRTAALASQIEGVRLVRHPCNRGYGAALKTGFCQASGDLIGFLDADGTYPPEYFPRLCQLILRGSDLVIGSRMCGADSSMPLTRKVGNRFFAALLSLLCRRRVTDSASGMRVFRKGVLERIYPLPDGLNLTPVMSTRALHEGIRVEEVPIPYDERIGRSKLSVVRDGSVFLRSIVWTALMYNPVRILGLLGLCGLAVTALTALAFVIMRVRGVTTLGPWEIAALFTALVSGVTGLSIFTLGVTFNYLVSLFYRRPMRQGLFGRPLFGRRPSSRPLEDHFWWLGLLGLLTGVAMGVTSLILGINGWEVERLWMYLLVSAMLILMSVQLVADWIVLRVLAELSQRDVVTQQELRGSVAEISLG
jgi:hypothetical protein